MKSPEVLLVMYYLGLGFVALLGWAGVAQALNEPLDDGRRARWRRASTTLAVIGLLHPAIALVARDVAVQVDRDDDNERDEPTSRHLRLANWCTATSLIIAGAFIFLHTLDTGGGGDAAMRAVQQALGQT